MLMWRSAVRTRTFTCPISTTRTMRDSTEGTARRAGGSLRKALVARPSVGRARISVRHRLHRLTADTNLSPSPAVEITGAERNAGQDQCRGRREGNRIERRGRKRNDSVFVSPRGLAHITAATRRAKIFSEPFQARGRFCIAARNAVAAPDDVWSQFREFFHGETSCVPVRIKWRAGARERSSSRYESAPRIHVHRRESIACDEHTVGRA